jgi:hypothetical protein
VGRYIASAPELRQPVTALSLGELRRRIEALMLPDVDVRLMLDRSAERERNRRRAQAQQAARWRRPPAERLKIRALNPVKLVNDAFGRQNLPLKEKCMLQRRPRTVRCQQCKAGIRVQARGPLPHYCSASCRQTAYLGRRNSTPMTRLAEDIATVKVRALVRAEVWSVLREAGLVAGPPPSPPKPRKPRLPVIDGGKLDAP